MALVFGELTISSEETYSIPGQAGLLVYFQNVYASGYRLEVRSSTTLIVYFNGDIPNAYNPNPPDPIYVPGDTVVIRLIGGGAYTVSNITGPSSLNISTGSPLPSATKGVAYWQALTVLGGVSPYVFSIESGALPSGLYLSAGGVLSGTPLVAGSFTFTVKATDATSSPVTKEFSLTVASADALSITTATLPSGQINRAYEQTSLAASGGAAPYSWSLAANNLPPGMSLSNDGLIYGTPIMSGTFSFTVRVTDSQGTTTTAALSIVVLSGSQVLVSTSSLARGYVGTAYSASLSATGGTSPYSWMVTFGALPAGLSLSSAGAITGTPTTKGTATFTVQATDAATATGTRSLSITIYDSGDNSGDGGTVGPNGLQITTLTLPNATLGKSYTETLAATGGISPYGFAVTSGSLPTGLNLSAGGALSGTPLGAAGSFAFTVIVTDSAGTPGTATRDFTIVVSQTQALSGVPNWITISKYDGDESGGSGSTLVPVAEVPRGIINGVNTVFTLSYTPYPQNWCDLSLNNQRQHPDEQIILVGPTITYAVPPRVGDTHHALYFTREQQITQVGNARLFDGVDDHINWGHDDAFNLNEDVSFGAWLKFPSDATGCIVCYYQVGHDSPYLLYVAGTNGAWDIRYVHDRPLLIVEEHTFSSAIPNNSWRYVGVSRDANAKTVSLWLGDGSNLELIETWTYINAPVVDANGGAELLIGSAEGESLLKGTVEEHYLWNCTTTAEDHFTAMTGSAPSTGLVLACMMGSSPELDYVCGKRGTITGTALVGGHN